MWLNALHHSRRTLLNSSINRLHFHPNKVLDGAVHHPSHLFISNLTRLSLRLRVLTSMKTIDLH